MIKPSVNLQELRRKIYRKGESRQAYGATMKGSGNPDDRRVKSGLMWRGLEKDLR